MIAVRMVQPTVYEVVNMVAMRHRFVSAVWTVRVRAMDFGRALHGICGVDRDGVLIHVILVHTMEMAIVQIVHMIVMANRSVSAVRAMLVSVVGVGVSRYMWPSAMLLLTGGFLSIAYPPWK
jgi:hypothetical protein